MSQEASGNEVSVQRAPTLYFIIGSKLLKGAFFTFLAITAYVLSDNNLPYEYQRFIHWIHGWNFLHVNPENRFWVHLASKVDSLTESSMLRVAVGTFIYSLFAWVEGVGLIYRVSWAGWLAIGESAFFIPIEVLELTHRFNGILFLILLFNIAIVWYLYQNKDRLFRHH
jgi:uncharacterized membrane protein (DUF2068 family)